jgi:hypothetical protein
MFVEGEFIVLIVGHFFLVLDLVKEVKQSRFFFPGAFVGKRSQ